MFRAGRPITPKAASIKVTSRSASDRPISRAQAATSDLRAIVLDIEGTTTPVAFVYETLFPYARRQLPHYLARHGRSSACQSLIARLRAEHDAEQEYGLGAPPWNDTTAESRYDSVVRYVAWLMQQDRKSTPLKELQGRIWEEGYRTGELVGALFDDVGPALHGWRDQKIGAGIFSSGSVLAQQLLFRHSSAGDLTPLLRWYFDTTIGAKVDPESYQRIASTVGEAPSSVLFVSDVVRELDAAKAAGLRTALSVRPGNANVPPGHGHPAIRSFDELT